MYKSCWHIVIGLIDQPFYVLIIIFDCRRFLGKEQTSIIVFCTVLESSVLQSSSQREIAHKKLFLLYLDWITFPEHSYIDFKITLRKTWMTSELCNKLRTGYVYWRSRLVPLCELLRNNTLTPAPDAPSVSSGSVSTAQRRQNRWSIWAYTVPTSN